MFRFPGLENEHHDESASIADWLILTYYKIINFMPSIFLLCTCIGIVIVFVTNLNTGRAKHTSILWTCLLIATHRMLTDNPSFSAKIADTIVWTPSIHHSGMYRELRTWNSENNFIFFRAMISCVAPILRLRLLSQLVFDIMFLYYIFSMGFQKVAVFLPKFEWMIQFIFNFIDCRHY